ncbi:MAG: DUF368 domain-containing protein [Fuerstiella sp.]
MGDSSTASSSDFQPRDPNSQGGRQADFATAGSGFLMGAADIVPGVSGGTVALILGVYERLVTAISRCDTTFFRLLKSKQWKQAADYIDLRFVIALGFGIACGIAALASVMNRLLTDHMSATFAAFSGMILASSLLVGRRIQAWKAEHYGTLLLGILIALWLVTLPALKSPPDTLWYLFLCGTIGITAMILPGISGAFILLLLNRYHYITDSIKGLPKGEVSFDILLSLGVFSLGCLTGLLAFSRVLRWLLTKYHDITMAMLCGFMLGSLLKLWPFQQEVGFAEKFKHKVFEPVLPEGIHAEVLIAIGLAFAGFIVVMVLDRIGQKANSDN